MKNISASELATTVGVSERKLSELFRRFLGKSAKQYQLDNRLRLARSKLRNPTPNMTVTRALTECGIEHHGRFAARYRARFGEPPSATLSAALRDRDEHS